MHRIIQNPALPVPPGLTALLLTISLALPACAREPASVFNDTATTEIYTDFDTLSLHDSVPIYFLETIQVM